MTCDLRELRSSAKAKIWDPNSANTGWMGPVDAEIRKKGTQDL